MNTLQCEQCAQQRQLNVADEPAASLLKANEAVETQHPVYVYCVDCKQHLCKPCDYRIHVGGHIAARVEVSPRGDSDSGAAMSKDTPETDQIVSNSDVDKNDNSMQNNTPQSKPAKQPNKIQSAQSKKVEQQPEHMTEQQTTVVNRSPVEEEHKQKSQHQRIQICDECAERCSHALCPKCEQALCQNCWDRIHNKGARLRHRQRSLQPPKFYPPHAWRKTSLTNQPSAGSSSQQDSLSQFKQEQVLDEIIGYDEKDNQKDRQMGEFFGALEVHLVDRPGFNQQNQLPNVPQNQAVSQIGPAFEQQQQFNIQGQQQKFNYARPPGEYLMQFGQSPQYIPQQHQHHPVPQPQMQPEAFTPYQQQQQKQQHFQNQMPISAPPFHATMPLHQPPYPSHQQFVPHPQMPHPYYFMQAPADQHIPPQYAHFPYVGQQPQQMYPQQMAAGLQQSNPAYQQQLQQQQHNFPERQQMSGQQLPTPTQNRKNSQYSEEDSNFSTSIHEEAMHHVPATFIRESETGAPQHAVYRHGNLNSESDQNTRFSKNPAFKDDGHLNQSQPFSFEPKRKDFSANPGSGEDDKIVQAGANNNKAFTPLRKVGQQSSSELPSPLMSTPNEMQRIGSLKNSKFMTPPLVMGGQSRANFKVKSSGAGQYVNKAAKPLKVPRDSAYTQGAVSCYSAKPPSGMEKRGPHIQYQVKTSKPNSMSSHEMNSDNSGDNQAPGYPYPRHHHGDQKSFDAYQLGPQSSSSAKHNVKLRNNVSGNLPLRKAKFYYDNSPHSQESDQTGNAPRQNIVGEPDSGNQFKGRKLQQTRQYQHYGESANSSGGNGSYYEKAEYKFKVSGGDRMISSQTGIRNDSRGSTSKPGSFSNYKSGSGGNQGSSASTYNGGNHKSIASSSNNPRTGSGRANHEGNLNGQQRAGLINTTVPILQPVIQIENKKNWPMRRLEESKSPVLSYQEENDLMKKFQLILFENAATGDLLILKDKFIDQLKEKTTLQNASALQAIDRAVNYGIIHQTDRNFANAQKIEFISLKIQIMSHQCLSWVITSLRRDEMTPTESAIKNRTKEAFNFKLQNEQWEAIMKSIQSNSHRNSSFTQSSSLDSSTQQQLTTTATTVSAQGITKIMKQSVLAEVDTGSGSTVRNVKNVSRPLVGNNSSAGGEATGSSDQPATDSLGQHNQVDSQTLQNTNSSSNNDGISSSAPPNVYGPSSSSNSNDVTHPKFKVVMVQQGSEEGGAEVNSTVSQGGVYAIYMQDEEVWTGVDIEDDTTVDRKLYQIMKDFLKDYFCAEDQQIQATSAADQQTAQDLKRVASNSDEYTLHGADLRMIPGGRYGCTQFLKICGPEAIKKCSVGKTTQMVQLAIKEDVLRHLKTQIVWSTQVDKHKTEQDTHEDQQILVQRTAKLQKVKEAIIEILAESHQKGMSLAQLPQYLKKKLPFNLEWNELGFPKLKDLLKSMTDQIKVELRDVNHPFAYLVHKQRGNQSQHQNQPCFDRPMFRDNDHLSEQIQDGSTRQMVYCNEKLTQIVQAVFTLLQMHPHGIIGRELKQKIQTQINFEFTFAQLDCGSEYEFVQKYIMPKDDSIEFITLYENGRKTFNIRSQKIFRKFFGQMVKEDKIIMMQETHQNNNNEQKRYQQTLGFYPSSMSHKNFNRGPQVNNHESSVEPSDCSSENHQNLDHQQRIQTQPNDQNNMTTFTLQQAYFPSCESIYGYGSETQSDVSSLKNQVKEISELSIDATINPFKQQVQKANDADKRGELGDNKQPKEAASMLQPTAQNHFYPWYPPAKQMEFQKNIGQDPSQFMGPSFQHQQSVNNGLFDNVKINTNIHSSSNAPGLAQAPYGNHHLMPAGLCYAIPIDQMDQEEDHRHPQQPMVPPQQHGSYQMFQPHNFADNDSPRVQETMQHLFDNSPGDNNEYYPNQHHNPNANAGNSDSENSQYKSMQEIILNQSIFSADLNRAPSRKDLQREQAACHAGHRSVDFNTHQIEQSRANAEEEHEYLPLFSGLQQQDDQVTSKTFQPVSTTIFHPRGAADYRFNNEQPHHITEETSGSHYSSNQKGENAKMPSPEVANREHDHL